MLYGVCIGAQERFSFKGFKRKGGKFYHWYVGPYKILKVLPKGVYLLQLLENLDVVVRVTGAHLKPYKSAYDAGNEPPLKKSRMESPTGDAIANSWSSTSVNSPGCQSPTGDANTSNQSSTSTDSPGSPKACSIPSRRSSSLLQLGNTKQNAVNADKEHKTKQKEVKPWIKTLHLNEIDKEELMSGDWLTDKHVKTVNVCCRNNIRPKQACRTLCFFQRIRYGNHNQKTSSR